MANKMERRHFELIAETLRDLRPVDNDVIGYAARAQWEDTVTGFANALRTTNPLLDADRFTAACGWPAQNVAVLR